MVELTKLCRRASVTHASRLAAPSLPAALQSRLIDRLGAAPAVEAAPAQALPFGTPYYEGPFRHPACVRAAALSSDGLRCARSFESMRGLLLRATH